jgi:cyclophilin family peptidyl-prolyl cis-trans isomerase
MKKLVAVVAVSALCMTFSAGSAFAAKGKSKAQSKNPVVTISTSMGDIKVQLDEEKAPISTKNFLTYVKEKHYDGTIFHRVIPNFMIQGGGMLPDMNPKGGTHEPIQNEASNGLKNDTGTIAMARTSDPNSATDQFFINVKDNDFLNYQAGGNPGYAVFGKVISGMDVVHKIEHVATTDKMPHQNVPVEAVTIKSIKVSK